MAYPTIETTQTIYYADTDAGGVVYYTRYLEFLEAGRMEYLTAIGCDSFATHHRGIFYAVRELHARHRAPARLGDRLKILTTLTETAKFSIKFQSEIRHAETGLLFHEAEVKCVCIDAEGKLLPLQRDLLEALENAKASPDL